MVKALGSEHHSVRVNTIESLGNVGFAAAEKSRKPPPHSRKPPDSNSIDMIDIIDIIIDIDDSDIFNIT